MTVLGNATAM